MATSRRSNQQLFLLPISGAQGGRAKTSVTGKRSVKASVADKAVYSTRLWHWLGRFAQNGWSWRMSQGSSPRKGEERLSKLPTSWKKAGIWVDGYRVTFPMLAYPITGIEYSLSQVLEPTVPLKSLLTAANCEGIMRREKRWGRTLDPRFEKALKETLRLWSNVAEASGTPWRVASAPRYVPKLEAIKAVIQTDQYCVARNLTWTECETLMGFPAGWTVVEED